MARIQALARHSSNAFHGYLQGSLAKAISNVAAEAGFSRSLASLQRELQSLQTQLSADKPLPPASVAAISTRSVWNPGAHSKLLPSPHRTFTHPLRVEMAALPDSPTRPTSVCRPRLCDMPQVLHLSRLRSPIFHRVVRLLLLRLVTRVEHAHPGHHIWSRGHKWVFQAALAVQLSPRDRSGQRKGGRAG